MVVVFTTILLNANFCRNADSYHCSAKCLVELSISSLNRVERIIVLVCLVRIQSGTLIERATLSFSYMGGSKA